MKCTEIEPLLLAGSRDELPATQRHALAAHLEGCPTCRQTHAALGALIATWQSESAQVPVPDAAVAWADLRSRRKAPVRPPARRFAPVIWLSLPLAAAAAIAFILLSPQLARPLAPELAHAEFVEAGDAGASPLVYVDKESGWLVVWASSAGT